MIHSNGQQDDDPRLKVAMPGANTPEAPYAFASTRSAQRKVAVFVAHGMGQQIPFETMDVVAAGLARVTQAKGGEVESLRAETCLLGKEKVQRIEIKLRDKQQHLEVHVYEGYWAPVTEGQVTIRDVISFLFRGGWNGWLNSSDDFKRWVFNRAVSYGRPTTTKWWLTVALAVVMSLVVANFVVTVMFAGRLANRVGSTGTGPADPTFHALTTLIAGWVIYSLVMGGLLWLRSKGKGGDWKEPPPQKPKAPRLWTSPLGFLFLLWIIYTLALGVVPLAAIMGLEIPEFGPDLFKTHSVLVWAGLLGVSWLIRDVMVQFPGDVAAYISTHTLDRFQEIRTRIKERVGSVARAVYSSGEYEGVVWVGHSLGSVVVYDALNALISDDELAGKPLRVVERTKMLLTFGSPLDKIAFIFAHQWAKTTVIREMASASLQPLILDYERFRQFPWVNIWSPADIISGDLDFYNEPTSKREFDVENIVDAAASTPLVAHIEYWNNRLLFEKIYEGVARHSAWAVANAGMRQAGG